MRVWKFILLAAVLPGLVFGVNVVVSQGPPPPPPPTYGEVTVTGDVVLTISTAIAGQNPEPVTDTSSTLAWTKGPFGTRITVATSLVSPKFILKVEAISVSGGSGVGEITISTTAQTLTNVSGDGSCTLKYTGSAQASDGTGTDSHIITYTITG